jgi:hypothetical protein
MPSGRDEADRREPRDQPILVDRFAEVVQPTAI